jgi:hypothetical protein
MTLRGWTRSLVEHLAAVAKVGHITPPARISPSRVGWLNLAAGCIDQGQTRVRHNETDEI